MAMLAKNVKCGKIIADRTSIEWEVTMYDYAGLMSPFKNISAPQLSQTPSVLAADNGGFWPQGVALIVLVALALWARWYITMLILKRIERNWLRKVVSVLSWLAFVVVVLLILVVINGGFNVADPNQEQRDRLGL